MSVRLHQGKVERTMFHSQDGFCFERQPNGGVRLLIVDGGFPPPHGDGVIVRETTLTAEAWGSVVASMSAAGETNGTWRAAVDAQVGPGRRTIIVNGREHVVTTPRLSYGDVVMLSGLVEAESVLAAFLVGDRAPVFSMTYSVKNGPDGILSPGRDVAVQDGMIFNVADTSNA